MITLTLLVLLALQTSQPPVPSPTKPGEEQQTQPAGSNTAAQDPDPQPQPVPSQVVNPIANPNANPANTQTSQQDQDSTTNWWIMVFTGFLTVITLLQWWTAVSQKRLLLSVERAYLNPIQSQVDWGDDTKPTILNMKISNSGNTSATLTQICSSMHPGPAPVRPQYHSHYRRSLLVGARESVTQPTVIPVAADKIEAIKAGKLVARHYGYFVYRDTFGRDHGVSFCFVYDSRRNAFVKESREHYVGHYRYPRTAIGRRIAAALGRAVPATRPKTEPN